MSSVLVHLLFFYLYGDHRELHVLTHSFPTRRSSDLVAQPLEVEQDRCVDRQRQLAAVHQVEDLAPLAAVVWRSEEHTSELQSLMRISYAVFCLKKKNSNETNTSTIIYNQ